MAPPRTSVEARRSRAAVVAAARVRRSLVELAGAIGRTPAAPTYRAITRRAQAQAPRPAARSAAIRSLYPLAAAAASAAAAAAAAVANAAAACVGAGA